MIDSSLRRTALIAALIALPSSRAAAQSDAAFFAAFGKSPAGLEAITQLKAQPQMPAATAMPAAARAQLPIIRTNTGLRFEIPAGWEWGGSTGNDVTIQHVGTKTGGSSPNLFEVRGQKSYMNFSTGWGRLDRDQQRTFPNGASARWRAGIRQVHGYAFLGEATLGSKVMSVTVYTHDPPPFDTTLAESAFLLMAETLQDVPAGATLYHPTLGIAADPLPSNSWSAGSDSAAMRFRCWKNGRSGDAYISAYPASAGFTDVRMVLADITGHFAKNGLTIGAVQSVVIAGGEVLWTEQPGSKMPYLGALRRDGRFYFLSVSSNAPGSCTQDPALADFLALAKSVRAWDGK